MKRTARDDYRLNDIEAVERLEEIYCITYYWFDEETGEFVYAEPVTWIYNTNYYEISQNDFN